MPISGHHVGQSAPEGPLRHIARRHFGGFQLEYCRKSYSPENKTHPTAEAVEWIKERFMEFRAPIHRAGV